MIFKRKIPRSVLVPEPAEVLKTLLTDALGPLNGHIALGQRKNFLSLSGPCR
jgi:hypothetical protein